MLIEAIRHIDNPEFGAVIFRRTSPQITNEGGLWDESSKIYPRIGALPREHVNQWRFPSGAEVTFRHLQHEKNKYDWQGSQIPLIGFDELTHFSESQFFYMLSRNRSTCGVRPYVRATTNPDARSWVKRFLAPWVDKKFHPRAESGELRWFIREDNKIIWCDPDTPFAKSVTFVRASIHDNRIGMEADPGYIANLKAMPEVERFRLLDGDWDAGQDDSEWQVIPTRWVEAAQERWAARGGDGYKPTVAMTVVGMDVAHGGKDQTVFAPRFGDWVAELVSHPGVDTPDGKTAAALAMKVWQPGATFNVDAIGYGASAAERLKDRPPNGYGVPAVAVNVASGSEYTDKSGKFRMRNQRAEMYWRLREELDPDNDPTLCLPPDPELLADLTSPLYDSSTGVIKIESKPDLKERLGRSPDKGDAVALAMLPVKAPGGASVGGPSRTPSGILQPPPPRLPGRPPGVPINPHRPPAPPRHPTPPRPPFRRP